MLESSSLLKSSKNLKSPLTPFNLQQRAQQSTMEMQMKSFHTATEVLNSIKAMGDIMISFSTHFHSINLQLVTVEIFPLIY